MLLRFSLSMLHSFSLSLFLTFSLSLFLSISPSIYLSISLFPSLSLIVSISLSLSLSHNLSLSLLLIQAAARESSGLTDNGHRDGVRQKDLLAAGEAELSKLKGGNFENISKLFT